MTCRPMPRPAASPSCSTCCLPLVAENDGAVLIGRGRPHGTAPNDTDRAWHQMAIDRCADHDVDLLGYYLATADGVFRLPEPLSAAS